MRRALSLLLVLVPLSTAPAAFAQAWEPPATAPTLAPLAPVAAGPISFPSATAPHIEIGVAAGADVDAVADALRPYASSLVIERAVGEISLVATNGAAVADLVAHDPRIAFAQPQHAFSQLAEPADAIDPDSGVPFDWQYDAVNAGPALAAVGGGSKTPVAVVDSGVDQAQPDLAGRLLPGYDATGTDGTVTDTDGHGTFVAGLISMVDGNGVGGKGVGGSTQVIPVRATLDGDYETDTAIVAGIVWAADNGAGVINLSLGSPVDDPAIDRAIDYATSKNVLVVASAGNSNTAQDHDATMYPAAYVGGVNGGWSIGLSVGATMPNGQVAGFSTHNPDVSIAAPGASPRPAISASTRRSRSARPRQSGTTRATPATTSSTRTSRTRSPGASPTGRARASRRRSCRPSPRSRVRRTRGSRRPRSPTCCAARRTRPSGRAGTSTRARASSTCGGRVARGPLRHGGAAGDPDHDGQAGRGRGRPLGGRSRNAGEALAGGVTLGLDTSSDGVNFTPLVLPAPDSIDQLIPRAAPSGACDRLRREPQLHRAGRRPHDADRDPGRRRRREGALVRAAARRRPRAQEAKLRLALGTGVAGKAVVQVESWTGTSWRAFDRVSVGFGKSATITKKVARAGRYRLRAHLMADPSFLAAVSGPVELRVR